MMRCPQPPEYLPERPEGVSNDLFEGAWLTEESTRLITGRGSRHASLYIVPTTRGWLCQVITVDPAGAESVSAAGGCITDFSKSTPIGLNIFDPDVVDSGKSAIVAGVVPETVTSIAVSVDGQTHTTPIENHAFLYELAEPTRCAVALC
jgi:hypothetical protein